MRRVDAVLFVSMCLVTHQQHSRAPCCKYGSFTHSRTCAPTCTHSHRKLEQWSYMHTLTHTRTHAHTRTHMSHMHTHTLAHTHTHTGRLVCACSVCLIFTFDLSAHVCALDDTRHARATLIYAHCCRHSARRLYQSACCRPDNRSLKGVSNTFASFYCLIQST